MAPTQAVASSSRSARSGRLPQAPASLLVQLPPDELKKFQASRANDGLVQASDIHLLASSIQERRERERRVFVWQQRLIDADESFPRAELKQAMTQLSLSSWLQVLQERHLDYRCAYPTCSRHPKKPHLSARETILAPDAPRFRISLADRKIQRDERDDAGGENGYCSKACWRRGEWVSRWVLEGSAVSRQESTKGAAVDGQFGSLIKGSNDGLGKQVDEGGRWERLIDEDKWEQVELLEDLEDKGEVDRLSDDESDRQRQTQGASKMHQQEAAPALPEESRPGDGMHDNLGHFSNMLDSLTIVERPTEKMQLDSPVIEALATPPRPTGVGLRGSTPDEIDDEREDVQGEEWDADSDDLDVLGELSMRSNVEGQDDLVSTILASSRHLHSVDGVGEDGRQGRAGDEEWSEDGWKRRKEEDDLFALAWQARDEEVAKGQWDP